MEIVIFNSGYPHGFLKQMLTNSTTTVRKVKGAGSEISFSMGKFRFVVVINKQGLVEKR